MPVEFRCTGCSKLLRTPDESAGKKAKCPQCGEIVDVPLASQSEAAPVVTSPFAQAAATNPFGDSDAGRGSRTGSANPYISPSLSETPFATKTPVAGLTHQIISFDEVMRTSWEFLKLQFGQVILCGLLMIALSIGGAIVAGIVGSIGQAIGNMYAVIFFGFIQQIISFGVNTYLQLGLLIFGLRLVRTGVPSVSDMFAGKAYLLRGLGLFLIVTLISYGAFLLCLAPAFVTLAFGEDVVTFAAFVICVLVGVGLASYIMLRLLLATTFLVDRNEGVIASLRLSGQFMTGNKLTTFLLLIVTGLLSTIFMLVTCFVGSIVVAPIFFGILVPTIYLTATGQPIYRTR
jgi:phage FluMu protein Com